MKRKKRILSILLSLTLMLGLMPGMSITARADVTTYNIWVGGTQVTSENATSSDHPTWSYDVTSNTLTLNNANITSGYQFQDGWGKAGIYYEVKNSYDALNIVLEGDNIISGDDIGYGMCGGYYFYGKFIFSGSGTLTTKGTSSGIYMRGAAGGVQIDGGTINASGDSSSGIYTQSSVVINDGTVEAKGSKQGINGSYGVSINGGNVTAIAEIDTNDDAAAISGFNGKHSFTGGTVIVKGGKYGIKMGGSYDIEIGSNVTSVTISGTTAAIKTNHKVKNFVAGKGWDTVEGTGEGTEIAVNTSGASLGSYKKILFPYKKTAATVTTAPKANDLSYNGKAQELVTSGTASGGTMNYALGTSATTAPTDGWSTSIPTGTDVKTYYVWYKAVGDSDHSDSEPKVITVTIKENSEVHTHKIVRVEAKEPTCTEDGYEAHYECTECGKWFNDLAGHYELDETEKAEMTKKATGHKWDDGVITQEATYDETGIKNYTCSVCGETKGETIPVKIRRSSSSSDSSDSDSESSGGGSSSKSGSISTKSIDVNGNTVQTQPDSGAPLSDRGGNWGNQENIWTYTKSDGSLAKGEWLNLEYDGHTYWYYFDDSTIMQTNWFDYNGSRYFLVPEMDGWRGRMATGWHMVDNKWYYFEPTIGANQGILYRGMTTPDGHTVGADGAWDGNGTTPIGAIHTGTTVTMN